MNNTKITFATTKYDNEIAQAEINLLTLKRLKYEAEIELIRELPKEERKMNRRKYVMLYNLRSDCIKRIDKLKWGE